MPENIWIKLGKAELPLTDGAIKVPASPSQRSARNVDLVRDEGGGGGGKQKRKEKENISFYRSFNCALKGRLGYFSSEK